MAGYFQTSKGISWALFAYTLLLVIGSVMVATFAIVVVGLMGMMVRTIPEIPREFYWVGGAATLFACWLTGFYLGAAGKPLTLRNARIGWSASAIYHAVWTALFLGPLNGTISMGGQVKITAPLALLSTAALAASIYLVVRYPRPPRLPPAADTRG